MRFKLPTLQQRVVVVAIVEKDLVCVGSANIHRRLRCTIGNNVLIDNVSFCPRNTPIVIVYITTSPKVNLIREDNSFL